MSALDQVEERPVSPAAPDAGRSAEMM